MTTVDNLNNFMAEKVMGWYKKRSAPHPSNPMFWFDENGAVCSVHSWNPSGTDKTSMNQAMMCADKHSFYVSDGNYRAWSISKTISDDVFVYEVTIYDHVLASAKLFDDLPKAICEAIEKAIEK